MGGNDSLWLKKLNNDWTFRFFDLFMTQSENCVLCVCQVLQAVLGDLRPQCEHKGDVLEPAEHQGKYSGHSEPSLTVWWVEAMIFFIFCFLLSSETANCLRWSTEISVDAFAPSTV